MAELPHQGLTTAQARSALATHGPNALPDTRPESLLQRFLRQFRNPVIYILLFALVFDLGVWWQEERHGLPLEPLTILVILLFNALLGLWQQTKSEAALARLKALAAPKSWVMRDGQLTQIASAELVPGDLIRVEAGERIPADGVLLSESSFSVDESVMTGESVPVEKDARDTVLSGTLAVRGLGWIDVSATGPASNMGQLAQLLQHVVREKTPLERRLQRFGRQIAVVVIGLACVVMMVGLLASGLESFNHIFLFAVALAVAAVPESLPAVLTLAMALGVERMARRKAVVRKLTAVEALGSVTVIATDKTGTLTENRMRVDSLDTPDPQRACRAMVLVNDADPLTRAGDPLELGLLDYATEQGVNAADLRKSCPRLSEKPFDAAWKYMRVTVQEGGPVSYLKGAPEVILARCSLADSERAALQAAMDGHAAQGFRMLALAWSPDEAEQDLHWLGLILLWDPPRAEVPGAIAQARQAGVRVLMITGDHPATARAIAERIGIQVSGVMTGEQLDALADGELPRRVAETSVFARVRPEHKLAIVQCLQAQGEVVAVTGDGVNDAPALKAADVGVAMGQRGSDVSREVADLVLLDDNFSTIVSAIEEGRSIYENIQKFVRTLFSTNVTEVLLIVVGAMVAFFLAGQGMGLVLPLTAAQILWVNLLTDSLPALAITTDRNLGVLQRSPRDARSPLLDRPTLLFVLLAGIAGGIVALLLFSLLPLWIDDATRVQTLVFCYLVFVQLSFVLPARRVNLASRFNYWVLLAVLAGCAAQLLALGHAGLGQFLSIAAWQWLDMLILGGAVLMSWLLVEAIAFFLRRHNQRQQQATG